jgi:hypothetical protein
MKLIFALARGAGESIKPGVKRSETPGSTHINFEPVKRATDRTVYERSNPSYPRAPARGKSLPPTSRARFRDSLIFLGFRYAPPQALCSHPLRGLRTGAPYKLGVANGFNRSRLELRVSLQGYVDPFGVNSRVAKRTGVAN